MSLSDFYQAPTAQTNLHMVYRKSFFMMRPAPEYATGEVLMASLYRKVGFPDLSEKNVPTQGRSFYRRIQTPPNELKNRIGKISAKSWNKVIDGVLRSPKQPNQSKQNFLQLTPLVPELALYTASARLRGNPWNPAELIQRIFGYSTSEIGNVEETWNRIFSALDVNNTDDIWARFLTDELTNWRPPEIKHEWKYSPLVDFKEILCPEDANGIKSPAKRFHKDLNALLELKTSLTRRQWISMFESILRIGSVSHVLWICHVHNVVWTKMQDCIDGVMPITHDLYTDLSIPSMGFWTYGDQALTKAKDLIRKYYIARIGINHVLHVLTDLGVELAENSLSTVAGLANLFQLLEEKRNELTQRDVISKNRELLDLDPKQLACTKGITSNMFEFVRYTLGQRQTAEVELKGYDQGYYLRKKGSYLSAPWIVTFGPVSAMTLTYCCAVESRFPRNIVDFCAHLANYGIYLHPNDFLATDLGSIMKNLGLILDSPDAEGGMMIFSPFTKGVGIK